MFEADHPNLISDGSCASNGRTVETVQRIGIKLSVQNTASVAVVLRNVLGCRLTY